MKRSRSPSLPQVATEHDHASKKIRSAIALVASGASSETLSPVVDLLSAAHRQVLKFERAPKIAIPLQKLLSLSDLELTILRDVNKAWKTLAVAGFKIRPEERDGGYDFTVWHVSIPGMDGMLYGGGLYPMTMIFNEQYPTIEPKCRFRKGFFHVNCYPSGGWQTSGLLLDIQWALCHPNLQDPASSDPYTLAKNDPEAYEARIREQVQEYAMPSKQE